MRETVLGKTGLTVSRIAYGTWQAGGGWGTPDEKALRAAIRRAREVGITLFDTARMYGMGAAERLLGDVLAPDIRHHRDSLVLATKGGLGLDERGRLRRDSHPRTLRRDLDESLRALGAEYVDIFQVHWPDPRIPSEDLAEVLCGFVDRGKARFIGVSNFNVEQMEALRRWIPIATSQPPYHLLRRGIEDDVLPYCREHGIGVLAYGPLAHGLLSGVVGPQTTFGPNDWRHWVPMFEPARLARNLRVVDELRREATSRGLSVAQLCLAWVLAQPGVDVAIVGARHAASIEDSARAADIVLELGLAERLADIAGGGVTTGGPSPEGWLQA
jgi:aryl-alcohol dehydrogenase-like predicted oxidoreductase